MVHRCHRVGRTGKVGRFRCSLPVLWWCGWHARWSGIGHCRGRRRRRSGRRSRRVRWCDRWRIGAGCGRISWIRLAVFRRRGAHCRLSRNRIPGCGLSRRRLAKCRLPHRRLSVSGLPGHRLFRAGLSPCRLRHGRLLRRGLARPWLSGHRLPWHGLPWHRLARHRLARHRIRCTNRPRLLLTPMRLSHHGVRSQRLAIWTVRHHARGLGRHLSRGHVWLRRRRCIDIGLLNGPRLAGRTGLLGSSRSAPAGGARRASLGRLPITDRRSSILHGLRPPGI